MRRKDREVVDVEQIEEIFKSCNCCRLGFNDRGKVYIVPMNFGYEINEGVYTFYFHSAKSGRKIDLIKQNNQVGFELDTNYILKVGESATECTAFYQSIIGNGTLLFVEDNDEKSLGMSKLMSKTTGKNDWEISQKMIDCVCIFKLVVDEISCKQHLN